MLEISILVVLLLCSAFFSGSETALTSLSLARAEALAEEGRPGGRALTRLKRDTHRMLIILLIGNNLVNTAAAALATVVATEYFGHLGPGLAVGGITLLLLIFGEITPKTFGARYSVTWALLVARPILWLGYLFLPLVWTMLFLTGTLHRFSGESSEPAVTESELITLAEHASRDGAIDADEHLMIQRIFDFGDLVASDVMAPRHQVFALDGELTVKEALPEVLAHPYYRIPLYKGQLDEIHRVVTLREILAAVADGRMEASLETVGHEPIFVSDNQSVEELFEALRANKHQMIVVVDEFGVLQGVITLEDILEELVGELNGAGDKAFAHQVQHVGREELLVEGGTELRVLKSHFDIAELDLDLEGRPTASVSRWLMDHIQRIAAQGEIFIIDGLEVRVERATSRAVQSMRIRRVHPVGEGRGGEAPSTRPPLSTGESETPPMESDGPTEPAIALPGDDPSSPRDGERESAGTETAPPA